MSCRHTGLRLLLQYNINKACFRFSQQEVIKKCIIHEKEVQIYGGSTKLHIEINLHFKERIKQSGKDRISDSLHWQL